MTRSHSTPDPATVLRSLQDATNAHDIDAIVACFAPDYRNETPVHPARGFTGNDQVCRNWTRLFTAIPDLRTEVVASAVSGESVWSEWEHRGTRPDGTPHLMRGVIVFTIDAELIRSARFFMEPVDDSDTGVDVALQHQVRPGARP